MINVYLSVRYVHLWQRKDVSRRMAVTDDHAATGRLQHGRYDSAGTKAAPEISSYHPCRCCAQGRFSAPSLPDCPTRRQAAEGTFGRFRAPAGSDGALRLRPRARRTPPRRASSSRLSGRLHAGPAGGRRSLHAAPSCTTSRRIGVALPVPPYASAKAHPTPRHGGLCPLCRYALDPAAERVGSRIADAIAGIPRTDSG